MNKKLIKLNNFFILPFINTVWFHINSSLIHSVRTAVVYNLQSQINRQIYLWQTFICIICGKVFMYHLWQILDILFVANIQMYDWWHKFRCIIWGKYLDALFMAISLLFVANIQLHYVWQKLRYINCDKNLDLSIMTTT